MEEVPAPKPEPSERTAEGVTVIGRLTQVKRRLPRETPARLVEVACLLTNCETDAQFTFGLDLMLMSLTASKGK